MGDEVLCVFSRAALFLGRVLGGVTRLGHERLADRQARAPQGELGPFRESLLDHRVN